MKGTVIPQCLMVVFATGVAYAGSGHFVPLILPIEMAIPAGDPSSYTRGPGGSAASSATHQ